MLAVDIGNTFTRIVAFSGEAISGRRAFVTRDLETRELAPALLELAALADAPTLWVSSVAPNANAVFASAAEKAGLANHFIRPGFDHIIKHRLTTPETTGADRLISAMAAGRRHLPGAKGENGYIVIQCGSAATVDAVDADGVFLGGYILPGPNLWLSGLSGAAQLPDLSAGLPDWSAAAPGNNTTDAIMHGLAVGLPGAVAAAARYIYGTSGNGEALPVVITGGWGEAVVKAANFASVYDMDLLLHGIRLFAEGRHGD